MPPRRYRPTRGVIAAGHRRTAQAGAHALREGGNAVDAAVAAAFMSFLAEPSLTTIAGGGFALVHDAARRRNLLYDFFAAMPGRGRKRIRTQDLHFYAVHLDFGGTQQEFHIGRGAAAVPGNVHGLLTMHRHHGRLPLAVLLAPTIAAACDGVIVTDNQAFVMSVVRGTMMASARCRALYAPRGHMLRPGECFRNPALADTMEALIREGMRSFYAGDIAHAIVRDIGGNGGLITHADLAAYRTIVRRPLAIDYRGACIVTNPAPSQGGQLIAFALQLLESLAWPIPPGPQAPELLRALVATMRLTNEARAEHPRLSSQVLARYRDRLRAYYNDRPPGRNGAATQPLGLGNTTHISVLDEHHQAVAITTSHGEGNGQVVRGTGILLNNLLGEEDINPQGFHAWRPGARLPSMMAPTFILHRQRPRVVMGSAGSNRLRTAIVQTIVKLLDAKVSLPRAVNGPRLHWERGRLDVEPGFPARAMAALRHLEPNLILWPDRNLFFGGLHAVMRHADGTMSGSGDIRRGGAVCVVR